MEHVSIIVPIYRGQKYINGMVTQIEKCAAVCQNICTLKLLLVNDDPNEAISSPASKKIEIEIIETDINRGIHGARVRGLVRCTGDYVLFLDQDDRIKPEYFSSQLSRLGKSDAVVCRLIHEGRQFYDTRMPFEEVIAKEFVLSVRNPIISPGQVLIRKNKIPAEWKETNLKNNGADDWLLWLCMLGRGRKFALNSEILFEHVVEGGNESFNVAHMIASGREMYDVVAAADIFSPRELTKLRVAVQSTAESQISLLNKFQKMFFVYDNWMKQQEQGRYIHTYLMSTGVSSVAIYGDSYIGKRLYHSLQNNGIEVRYFIDMNAAYLEEEIPIYAPEAYLPSADLILISLVEGVEEIRKNLETLTEGKICSVQELLEKLEHTI